MKDSRTPARRDPTRRQEPVVGARRLLIAFNAVLDDADLEVAQAIARAIRTSSGGMPRVQAMGVWLASRTLAQVTLNLLDYRRTSPRVVAEQIALEAACHGAAVREHELVGCAPADALADWPASLAPIAGLKPTQLLAQRSSPATREVVPHPRHPLASRRVRWLSPDRRMILIAGQGPAMLSPRRSIAVTSEGTMPTRCDCGADVPHAFEELGCLQCGAPCCRACAVSLESAPYCRGCAAALLGTSAPRGAGAFILH